MVFNRWFLIHGDDTGTNEVKCNKQQNKKNYCTNANYWYYRICTISR